MRNIFIVNATQVVVSETHPEGAYSAVSGYPKTFDSRNYNATAENPDGDVNKALRVAKSDYCAQQAAFLASDTRAMWTVTLSMADGRQIASECFGAFPDVTPEPEEAAE
jgi:hypothetical protein